MNANGMTPRAYALFSVMLLLILTLISGRAHAWDCNVWSQSTYPGKECYKAPVTPAAPGASLQQTQQQAQQQAQTQSAQALAASRSTASAASVVGATTAGNSQGVNVSDNSYSRSAANTVSLGGQIITGCGVSGQAGGSNTRGSAILGVGFTTSECYAYIEAQAFHAVGDEYDACLVLHSTDAARRTEKRLGHPLGDCVAPAAVVIERMPAGTWYSEDELQARIADAVRAVPPCPQPSVVRKHARARKHVAAVPTPSPACVMPPESHKDVPAIGTGWTGPLPAPK